MGQVTVLSLAKEAKRKMEDDRGDDQMQMETEEIAEVEVQRWISVMLVEEEQIQCGKPNFWLYGFRKAASAWDDSYAEVMEEAGFRRGVGCSVIFRHEEKDLIGVVHVDDFVFGRNNEDLKWVAEVLSAKFVIKEGVVLGPEDENQKDEVLLGRFVRWRSWRIEWEADVKHRKLLLERFGLDGGAKA